MSFLTSGRSKPLGVLTKLLNSKVEVSKFKIHLCFFTHFWTNSLWKYINPRIHSGMGLSLLPFTMASALDIP